MTHEEILQGLYDHTLIGNAPEVKDLVNEGLADGMGPESMTKRVRVKCGRCRTVNVAVYDAKGET